MRRITFRHPFQLAGMAQPHRPGSFDLVIENVQLDVSWEAYRSDCRLMLTGDGSISAYPVALADIEAALNADAQHDTKTGNS